ncbi:hypothetical protein [Nonomuraea dietziae]|uniref:hypothetical protein n=1 Tax=Nonomuraea dietziae TaxID=65515 RepID=UPI00344721A5
MQALDSAMAESEFRKLPLTVMHAWQRPYGGADEEAKLHLRKAAEHDLRHGANSARHAPLPAGWRDRCPDVRG